jgi:hypothetical protein
MKQPYSIINPETNEALYRCRPCDAYLPSEYFFDSDLEHRRSSCKECTTSRSTKSRRGDKNRLTLSRFKLWGKRNQHPECVNFELEDVAAIIGASELEDVVLRPVRFDKPRWIPSDLRAVSISHSRKKSAPLDWKETEKKTFDPKKKDTMSAQTPPKKAKLTDRELMPPPAPRKKKKTKQPLFGRSAATLNAKAIKRMWSEAKRKATLQVIQEADDARMELPPFLTKEAKRHGIAICPYRKFCCGPDGYCCNWMAYQSEGDCLKCKQQGCDCGERFTRCPECET